MRRDATVLGHVVVREIRVHADQVVGQPEQLDLLGRLELGCDPPVVVELSPLLLKIFKDGQSRYGAREWSPNIVKRLEDACDVSILAPGFPAEMVDDEPEAPGEEVKVRGQTRLSA